MYRPVQRCHRFHMHRSIGATWRGVCDRVFLVVCFRLCLHIAKTTLSTLYSGSVVANVKTVCSGGVVINVKKVYSATLPNGATQKAAPHKACETWVGTRESSRIHFTRYVTKMEHFLFLGCDQLFFGLLWPTIREMDIPFEIFFFPVFIADFRFLAPWIVFSHCVRCNWSIDMRQLLSHSSCFGISNDTRVCTFALKSEVTMTGQIQKWKFRQNLPVFII